MERWTLRYDIENAARADRGAEWFVSVVSGTNIIKTQYMINSMRH